MTEFQSLKSESSAEFKDRGSRFIGYAKRVQSREEAEEFVASLRIEHPKSRHVCYAWRMEAEPEEYRANDDGEPSGSAGLPILNQIRSNDLSFVVIAVVRYFGGTLLGVPGLINAYKTAAAMAVEAGEVLAFTKTIDIGIAFDYAEMETVMRFIKQSDYEILNRSYEKICTFQLRIPEDELETFKTYIEPHSIRLL